jgi:hypothetical protein
MEGEEMRDKIAELFKEFYDKTFAYRYYHNEANLENVTPDYYADQILALFPSLEKREDDYHAGLAQGYKQGKAEKIDLFEQDAIDYGAKMMAKQIRKSIEDNSGVFGDEIDEKGNVIQSDANWILQRFRDIPSLEGIEVEEKCIVFHDFTRDEITRPVEWGDIEIKYWEVVKTFYLTTKSGGRLRVKKKP